MINKLQLLNTPTVDGKIKKCVVTVILIDILSPSRPISVEDTRGGYSTTGNKKHSSTMTLLILHHKN